MRLSKIAPSKHFETVQHRPRKDWGNYWTMAKSLNKLEIIYFKLSSYIFSTFLKDTHHNAAEEYMKFKIFFFKWGKFGQMGQFWTVEKGTIMYLIRSL